MNRESRFQYRFTCNRSRLHPYLGLHGFAGTTFMVAAHMAHWFGGAHTDLYLAPFAAMCGGLAQFSAGMWVFKARDGVATAMHGTWGSFWMGYGLLPLAFLRGTLAQPTGAFSAWGRFIALAAITWMGSVAAAGGSRVIAAVLGFLAAGSTVSAVSELLGSESGRMAAGYLFIIAALIARYRASALMLEGAYKRPVLGLDKTRRAWQEPILMPGTRDPASFAASDPD